MFVFLKLVKVLGVLIPFSPFKKTGVLEITLKIKLYYESGILMTSFRGKLLNLR